MNRSRTIPSINQKLDSIPISKTVMESQKFLFCFCCLILLSGVEMARISIRNNCQFTVWPGTLTSGNTQISNTGFELAAGRTDSVDVPAPWTGRIFGRTRCTNNGQFNCQTGNCGPQVSCNGAGGAPPATLAEFTLAAPGGQDFYDVSLVDGFNLPMSIAPQGGSGDRCRETTCPADVNNGCPRELAVTGDNGNIVACRSACVAFGEPRYCCTNEFNSPDTCRPTNFSMYFKQRCPQAYSYAYDDRSSTFSCMGTPNYLVTFCP